MATIRQSQIDTTKLGDRIGSPASGAMPAPGQSAGVLPISTSEQSPFMLSPMPLVASTADLFVRQFYNGSRVPQQRIFPVK